MLSSDLKLQKNAVNTETRIVTRSITTLKSLQRSVYSDNVRKYISYPMSSRLNPAELMHNEVCNSTHAEMALTSLPVSEYRKPNKKVIWLDYPLGICTESSGTGMHHLSQRFLLFDHNNLGKRDLPAIIFPWCKNSLICLGELHSPVELEGLNFPATCVYFVIYCVYGHARCFNLRGVSWTLHGIGWSTWRNKRPL